ncbi:MAG: SUMF1/EgtB/PvdO family nonheme iron enzyme, partial [Oligoflexia bacterium]|nr:SUMF1/EgtB/PvdO family nonheme iron enzyme [Oligoflexia bacterium]
MTDPELFERLKGLNSGQWADLLVHARVPEHWLPGPSASPAERAKELVRLTGTIPILAKAVIAWLETLDRRPAADPAAEDPKSWLAYLCRKARDVPVLGFHDVDKPLIDIEHIYVPLRLEAEDGRLPAARDGCGGGADGGPQDPCPDSIWKLLAPVTTKNTRKRGLIVVGPAGCGKTTLAQHVFHQVATGRAPPDAVPEDMQAVWVAAHRLPKRAIGQAGGLTAAIEAIASSDDFSGAGRALMTRDARVLVLIDGIDELRDDSTRKALGKWLSDEALRFDGCRFVLTCRPHAFERARGKLTERFRPVRVQPLSDEAITRYVHAWWSAVQGEHCEHLTPSQADDRAKKLLDEVLHSGVRLAALRLLQLAANPLTLSILCLVDWAIGRLPRARAELYDECLSVLLQTRPEQRDATIKGLDARQGKLLLQPLAWQMQEAAADELWREDEIPSPKALSIPAVTQALTQSAARLPKLADASGVVDIQAVRVHLEEECGVLVRPEQDELAFAHLTFQEYLAAAYAQEQPTRAAALAKLAHKPAWREVILLAMGLPGLGWPLLRGLLLHKDVGELEDLIRRAVAEADVALAGPFIDVLDKAAAGHKVPAKRLIVALRLLPESAWRDAAKSLEALAEHQDAQISALATRMATLNRGAPVVAGGDIVQDRPIETAADLARFQVQRRELPVVNMPLVWVPPGVFWMGSSDQPRHPAYDLDGGINERPPRRVRITQGFWLGEHPVTNAQWRVFCEATGADPPSTWRQEGFDGQDVPVTSVSWLETQRFLAWLSGRLGGETARLPSEAEWEWAARGPEGRWYPWGGDKPMSQLAVFGRPDHPLPVGGR